MNDNIYYTGSTDLPDKIISFNPRNIKGIVALVDEYGEVVMTAIIKRLSEVTASRIDKYSFAQLARDLKEQ